MDDNLQSLPTDDRIDQLFLDSAFPGRLSSNDPHMLVNYVRGMRDAAVRSASASSISSRRTKPANFADAPE